MVARVVRPRPDHGHRTQKISDTVALTGAICDAPDGSLGRGRACSLFFLGNVNPIWPQRARLSWPHLDETPAGHPSTSCHPLSFGASEAI